MFSIGIDLGGTNVAAAVVSEEGEILSRSSIPTPKKWGSELPQQVAEAMVEASFLALEGTAFSFGEASSVGIGTPGTVDPTTQTIGLWSNMDFHDVPLGKLYTEAAKKRSDVVPKVYLENDANAAALGEFFAGAGKNGDSLVAVTLGTGVGGGAIFNGKLFTGFNYAGMEIGHFVLKAGGRPCSCGRKGCFEAYSSATALISRTKEMMEQNTSSKLWEIASSLDKVNGKTAFDAALLGDETGLAVVDEYIYYLASGVTSLINLFQPEILCIGGGVAGQKDKLITPLLKIVDNEDYARGLDHRTRVVVAELGNDAGIIGAGMLWKFSDN
ncbi:MAG: ROK family protein [Eubacteriales bacterium]